MVYLDQTANGTDCSSQSDGIDAQAQAPCKLDVKYEISLSGISFPLYQIDRSINKKPPTENVNVRRKRGIKGN